MAQILCDTNAVIWWLADRPELTAPARAAITGASPAWLSLASVWEISIKVGKLGPGRASSLDRALETIRSGAALDDFQILDLGVSDCVDAGLLPRHHGDPFDRLLAAQALRRGLPVVSSDDALDAYGVTRIW